jgi:hypothetical protein
MSLHPGEWATVATENDHAFRNETARPAIFLVVAAPAGLDEFLRQLAALIDGSRSWPPSDRAALEALNSVSTSCPRTRSADRCSPVF